MRKRGGKERRNLRRRRSPSISPGATTEREKREKEKRGREEMKEGKRGFHVGNIPIKALPKRGRGGEKGGGREGRSSVKGERI